MDFLDSSDIVSLLITKTYKLSETDLTQILLSQTHLYRFKMELLDTYINTMYFQFEDRFYYETERMASGQLIIAARQ
jgi:hypothetical protein